jgi:7 transmembrane sweet-taste receptor of 3 GCPR
MLFRIVKGNQSMGICLLVGILSLYATSYLFIWQPTIDAQSSSAQPPQWLLGWICRWRVAAHALAHTLCFGVMIVKAVQLHNAEAMGGASAGGMGGGLSYAMNYWLLYFFIVGVQVAVCAKWLVEPGLLRGAVGWWMATVAGWQHGRGPWQLSAGC